MTNPPISVIVVEDQARLRSGLGVLIDATETFRTIGAFVSIEEALAAALPSAPAIALVDIGLPGMSGIEGLPHLLQRYPALQVLMLTVQDGDDAVFDAICAGASGYLLKDTPPDRLVGALRELHGGGAPMSPAIARKVLATFRRTTGVVAPEHDLSPRELDVLRLLAEGHSYKTAAVALELSLDTVRTHVRRIYEKLHVHSKSEAVTKAIRQRIV